MQVRQNEQKDTTFEERWVALVDKTDGFMHPDGYRYRHTPDLFFNIKPEIEAVTISDAVSPNDYLFQYKLYYGVHVLCLLTGILIGLFVLPLSPIVWMDITGTDNIFFGNTTAESAKESPLPNGLVNFSTTAFKIWCSAFSFVFTNLLLVMNPSMLRLQWKTTRIRISVTLALNVAYAIAVISMFPSGTHALYMYARTACLTFVVFFDSLYAYLKLRMEPKAFAYIFGGSGTKGWLSASFAITGTLLLLADAFRHYLVMFVTDDVSIISINVTNPFNGNSLAFTNKRLASITYFNGVIFFAIAMMAMINLSKMTTISQTKFIYKS